MRDILKRASGRDIWKEKVEKDNQRERCEGLRGGSESFLGGASEGFIGAAGGEGAVQKGKLVDFVDIGGGLKASIAKQGLTGKGFFQV